MLDDGLYTRFPKPDAALAFHDAAALPAGVIGITPGYALANVDSVDISVKGVGGHGAYPQTTKDPIVLAVAHRHHAADPGQPRERPRRSGGGHRRQLPRRRQAQHHLRRGQAPADRAQLHAAKCARPCSTASAASPAARRSPPACPTTACRSSPSARPNSRPSTFNTEKLSARALALFTSHFGAAPRDQDPGGDGRRGFQPLLARRQDDREPDLLGRRSAPGRNGTRPAATRRSCPRSTARSGRPTPRPSSRPRPKR